MNTLLSLLNDPVAGKLSSARLVGLLLALALIAFVFVHPDEPGTAGVLLTGALVALGLRKTAEGE